MIKIKSGCNLAETDGSLLLKILKVSHDIQTVKIRCKKLVLV